MAIDQKSVGAFGAAVAAAALSFAAGRATLSAPSTPPPPAARPKQVCVCTVGQRRYIDAAAANAADMKCDADPPEVSPLTGKNRRGPIFCY